VTGKNSEKIAQNLANPFFCQNYFPTLTMENSYYKVWLPTSVIMYQKGTQSKQSPNKRNFAQSGQLTQSYPK
jgi:hypothetical protein